MSTLSTIGRNYAASGISVAIGDSGFVKVAAADDGIIATLNLKGSAASGCFSEAATGVLTAGSISGDPGASGSAAAATKVFIQASSGLTIVTATLGASSSGKEFVLATSSAVIANGAVVTCSALTLTVAA